MFEDGREVSVVLVHQLHQIVLDLDVVVGPREAQTGRGLYSTLRLMVELPDQGSQVEVHKRAFTLKRENRVVRVTGELL
jgi:hypothetical protein